MKGEIHNPSSFRRWNGSQRRIGITGGIASGKTTIGNFLKQVKNIPILDADVYAHEALEPGKSAAIAILDRYGNAVKAQSKNHQVSIDRAALSKVIFSDPYERLWVEQVIHPIVQRQFKKELELKKHVPVIALIIPLLFETGFNELCSEVWVVHCTLKQQAERLAKRDKLSECEVTNRIQAQWPLEKKICLADVVIDNAGDFQTWLTKVDKLC